MTQYYKKRSPDQKFWLPQGFWLPFQKVDHDWGILATDDATVHQEIAIAQRENRGAIWTITKDEFDKLALKKKQSGNLKTPWREEFANSRAHRPEPSKPLRVGAVAVALAGDAKVMSGVKPKTEPGVPVVDFERPSAGRA